MFEQGGLSLDQAPPVSVVFGFFLTGSIFGILSGLGVLYYGSSIFDISSIGAIVIVHLLALGVMMSFMLGALFQMLPVIAGVTLESPIPRSNMVKFLLIVGTLTLVLGFMAHLPMLFIFASIFLGSALLYISFIMLSRLYKIDNHSASSRGILAALSSMLIFVLLALYMTTTYAQMHDGVYFLQIKQIHYSFALFGWMALLIVSISFQTVEMFYVTPAYPHILSKYTTAALSSLLFLLSIAIVSNSETMVMLFQVLIYLFLIAYALTTLRRLSQRKRPLSDATIWFWRTGMGSLIISMIALLIHTWIDTTFLINIASILFISFALSVLFAMLYKIVPFLTWFHLNAQGYFTAPMMHEVIHPKTAKKHYWIHIAMILALAISLYIPIAIYIAGALMLLSFGWVTYQVFHAIRLYKHTQETGERFDMGMEMPSI